jgi:TIR domain
MGVKSPVVVRRGETGCRSWARLSRWGTLACWRGYVRLNVSPDTCMSRNSSTSPTYSHLELLRQFRRDDLLRKVVVPYFSHRGWKVSELLREKDIRHGCDILLVSSVNNEPVLAGVHIEAGMDIESRLAVRQQIKTYAETAFGYRYGADNRGRLYKYFWITSGRIEPTLRDDIREALEEADAWGRVEIWDAQSLYEELQNTDLLQLEVFRSTSDRTGATYSSRPRLKVFVSYAIEDRGKVQELVSKLKRGGFDPWFDKADIKPGQDWEIEIQRAMLQSHAILLCLSPRSVKKEGFVQKELGIAREIAQRHPEGTIFLIPVKLEEVEVPQSLRKLQWTSLFERGGYSKLVSSLRSRVEELHEAGRL